MIELRRGPYGKKSTPTELREYQIEGRGPVGTLKEFKEAFPNLKFEIVD